MIGGAALLNATIVANLSLANWMPYTSQVVTYTYDPSGRVTSVVYTGTGAPNGCTNSTPTWGTGTLGCFRWSQ